MGGGGGVNWRWVRLVEHCGMVHFDMVFCGFSMEVVNCSKDEVCNFFLTIFQRSANPTIYCGCWLAQSSASRGAFDEKWVINQSQNSILSRFHNIRSLPYPHQRYKFFDPRYWAKSWRDGCFRSKFGGFPLPINPEKSRAKFEERPASQLSLAALAYENEVRGLCTLWMLLRKWISCWSSLVVGAVNI